jgi:hypothetical protein
MMVDGESTWGKLMPKPADGRAKSEVVSGFGEGEGCGVRMRAVITFFGWGDRIAGSELTVSASLGSREWIARKFGVLVVVARGLVVAVRDSDFGGTGGSLSSGGVSGDTGEISLGVKGCCLSAFK